MVRVDCPQAMNRYLLKISFKRWAKLWSVANLKLYPLSEADSEERRDLRIGSLIAGLPGPVGRLLTHKRYSLKKRSMRPQIATEQRPNCLMIECYNPQSKIVLITVTIRRDGALIPYQKLLQMESGFNRHQIAVTDIQQVVDLSTNFHVDLTPNEISEGTTLYFGAMDFVFDRCFQSVAAKSLQQSDAVCKCVVWDLDKTLWNGVLIEDGPENLSLKTGIADILSQLDARGILLSVASKNNPEDAMGVLRRLGIADYFLFPQISWDPKSQGIRRIATALNIGIDSLLFVDDSRFEREEVMAACPEVMVMDALEYQDILIRPDCVIPVTEEGRNRRIYYRGQERRESAQQDFHGNYSNFLRGCNLRLTVRCMSDKNLDRVHELTQRTNQMNFSGIRYTREQLLAFLGISDIATYVLDCEDRFGSYGTVGFCLVNLVQTRMTDLMFSCRIQGKRIEHAFVAHLIRKQRESGAATFLVDYRRTKKNAAPGKVFEDLGFDVLGEAGGVTRLAFPSSKTLSDEDVIKIEDHTKEPQITSDEVNRPSLNTNQ
jgi:FkbH-like protein